jgi:hypothetical protein
VTARALHEVFSQQGGGLAVCDACGWSRPYNTFEDAEKSADRHRCWQNDVVDTIHDAEVRLSRQLHSMSDKDTMALARAWFVPPWRHPIRHIRGVWRLHSLIHLIEKGPQ